MAQVIGHVNEVSGLFYAKVGVDETRLLKVGDTLFKGEEIAGGSGNSASDILKLSIDSSGEELSVLSHNQLLLNDTLLATTIEDLEELEAPAAGDTEVDTLVGRFSERTAGETNISTDLRDASFTDDGLVEENSPTAEPILEAVTSSTKLTLEETVSPVEPAPEEPVSPVEPAPEEPVSPVEPAPEEPVSPVEPLPQYPVNITIIEELNPDGSYTYTASLTAGNDYNTPVTAEQDVDVVLNNGLTLSIIAGSSIVSGDTSGLNIPTLQATDALVSDAVRDIFDELNVNFTLGENSILTNKVGNILSDIDMNINFEGSILSNVTISPEVDSDGFAINSTGEFLTSTVLYGDSYAVTYKLVYITNSDGSVSAVTNEILETSGQIDENFTSGIFSVFTLTPNTDGTYTVRIDGDLDGKTYLETINIKGDTPSTGGYVETLEFTLDNDTNDTTDDLNIKATAATTTGETLNVNYSSSNGLGLGVEHNAKITSGEVLTLLFDKEIQEGSSFILDQVIQGNSPVNDIPEVALYSGSTALTGVDYEVVGEVLTINDLGDADAFDRIEFTNAGSGNGYTVKSISADIDVEVEGTPQSINIDVLAVDNDGDTASGVMQVTFDNDGEIYGTSNDETIDFEPSDSIDAQEGEDTLVVGDDTLLDFSTFSDGSVTDIENVDLRGGVDTTVTNLTVESVFDVTDSNNMLNILGGNITDSVQVSTTEWGTSTGTTSVDGVNYNQYEATYNDGFVNQTVYLNVQDEVVEEIV